MGYFTGNAYIDGSGMHVRHGIIPRAGSAVVQMNKPMVIELAVSGPLPGPIQTVPLAELWALELALRHGCQPLDLATDCFGLVAAFLKGKESCCAPGRMGAHIWIKVWFHLEDMGGHEVLGLWRQA